MKLSLAIVALALAVPAISYAQDSSTSTENIPILFLPDLLMFLHSPINQKI
jgi:hypothetical protein